MLTLKIGVVTYCALVTFSVALLKSGLRTENMEIDRVLATEFCDKRDGILKSGVRRAGITKTQAIMELKNIEKLRNRIAHSGDIASTHAQAAQTVKSVKFARLWIGYLTDLLTMGDLPSRA